MDHHTSCYVFRSRACAYFCLPRCSGSLRLISTNKTLNSLLYNGTNELVASQEELERIDSSAYHLVAVKCCRRVDVEKIDDTLADAKLMLKRAR